MAGFVNPFPRRAIYTSDPMQKPDPYGEWVLLGRKQEWAENQQPVDEELLAAARAAWPRVLAHARQELGQKGMGAEATALAAEVWEGVLNSVSKALQRKGDSRASIGDLESYLIAAFHHRFNRVLKREQKRHDTIELVSSTLDLERFENARDTRWVSDLEHAISVKQVIVHMDEWTRRVWRARQYGYSWREIAERLGLSERHVRRKFRDGLEKTRDHVIELVRKRKTSSGDQQ